MKRHDSRWFLLAYLVFWAPCGQATAAPRTRPNVILFLVDDMGWMDSTPYGSRYYDTPNMQRLARRAMRFTDAYACPLCSPTRASIMTSQYSARHGITSATGHLPPQPPGFQFLPANAAPNRPIVIPISKNYLEPSQYTLAEALRDAGWRTAHIGKWHLGLAEEYWPERQGFEFALHGAPDPGPPSYFSPYGYKKAQTFKDGPPGEYITDRFTDEAIRYITANRDHPFFLNLWHHGVHGPWGHKPEVTATFVDKADPRGKQANPIMASMLKSVDESLGRILDTLDALRLADDTIIVFFSDNGGNTHSNTPEDRKRTVAGGAKAEQLKDWKRWAGDLPPTNNEPLRDGKASLYEGGIRVPLMIARAGVVEPGSTSAAVVHAIDLYPTILDMLDLKPDPRQNMDGISFVPALEQSGPPAREALFTHFPHGGPHRPPGVTVRKGDWKLIRWFETGPTAPEPRELYNLRSDLGETHNLAATMPEKVKELDALMDRFLEETGAIVPKPNPDYRPVATATPGGLPAPALDGWVAKSARVTGHDGVIVVEGDGKNPFLAVTNLKLGGPVTLRMRTRSAGVAGKVQWRTSDQQGFPATGQSVDFTLPPGGDWGETSINLPVVASLVHLRLFLPAGDGPVEIDWIALEPASGDARRWAFDAK